MPYNVMLSDKNGEEGGWGAYHFLLRNWLSIGLTIAEGE